MHGDGGSAAAAAGDSRWTVNAPAGRRRALDVSELWAYRELVGFLALRDLKVRYKQAALGGSWAVLQPLAGLAVFWVVFGRLAGVPTDGLPYPVFAFLGLALWGYVSGSVEVARTALVSNASLVTKVYFPRLAAPLAGVLPRLVDLGIAAVLLAVIMALAGVAPGPQVVLVLPLLAAAVVLAFGVGVLLAAVTVRYRDTQHVVPLLLQLWLLASPVAYPSSLVPEQWRWAYALNPLAGLLDTARWVVLDAPPPGPVALLSVATGLLILGLGLRYFLRTERHFADVI